MMSDHDRAVIDSGRRHVQQWILREADAQAAYDDVTQSVLAPRSVTPSDAQLDALAERIRLACEAREHARLMVDACFVELYLDFLEKARAESLAA